MTIKLNQLSRRLIVLIAFLLPSAFGQNIVRHLAEPGPTGVYVNLGLDLPSSEKPSRGITAYRVERRMAGDPAWKIVAEVQAPVSLVELTMRLAHAQQLLPEALRVDSIPADWIWRRMQISPDSLRFWGGVLPVRLALGITYFDSTASAVTPLEYRVSSLDAAGKPVAVFLSESVFFPMAKPFGKLASLESAGSDRAVSLLWSAGVRTHVMALEVYRRAGLTGGFSRTNPHLTMKIVRDSLRVEMQDRSVESGQIYEYVVVPMDAYGNRGVPSDTGIVGAYDFIAAATAIFARVENADSLSGLRIRWQLGNPGLLRAVRILRSEQWEEGFDVIAELPAAEGAYTDPLVEPMKDYHYYLEAVGPLGERTRACATMHGLFQSAELPLPPSGLMAEPATNGIRLTWVNNEQNIRGFYLYRAGVGGTSFEQISPFLPGGAGAHAYVDSSATLSPRLTYSYILRSENSSYHLSPPSDTVHARPGIRTAPRAPLGVRVNTRDGGVQLTWHDLYAEDPALLGYRVYRRELSPEGKSKDEYVLLPGMPLEAFHNHFTDSDASPARSYEYAVESIDAFGGVSPVRSTVTVPVRIPRPLPPASLRASVMPDGILLEWDEAAGEITSYKIYRYERGQPPALLRETGSDVLEYEDTAARPEKRYFYHLTSVNAQGRESEPGREVGAMR